MTTPTDIPKLDVCGCCEADVPQPKLYNRPGLSALAYRIGTHATFLRRMLARLPIEPIPDGPNMGNRPLTKLTTRAGDDPAIALLDAWATVADVLTFYQERIANESYLRTATERRSVLELGRTISYELNPGVAANTYLAFTVEDVPGAPGVATVPQGTKVQSMPGQDQLPQTFETSAEITARAEWNALRPRLTRPQELAIKADKVYLLGLSTGLAEEDSQAIPKSDFYPLDRPTAEALESFEEDDVQAQEINHLYLAGTSTNLKAGDLILLVGRRGDQVKTLVRSIQHVQVEEELRRTRLDFEEELVAEPAKPISFKPIALRFGAITLRSLAFTKAKVDEVILGRSWRERDITAFLSIQRWSRPNLLKYVNTPPKKIPSRLPPTEAGMFVFRERLGLFGHNAPLRASLDLTVANKFQDWDAGDGWEIWKDSRNSGLYYTEVDIYLERSLRGLTGNSWIVLERPVNKYKIFQIESVSEASPVGFAMSTKASGLTLATEDGHRPVDKTTDDLPEFKVRNTTAHVQSERLELVQLPIEAVVAEESTELQLDQMVLGLQVDQPLALSGERADLPGVNGSEIVILADIHHSGGYTILTFKAGLQHPYLRSTVTLNANVAQATHGETVVEVLGSGDGSLPNQRFTLKKPPLTYVSAATASGSESTLRVRVNGLLWTEAPRLYGLDERSENYIVQIDDDGKTHLIFGNGSMGARLPTGLENVVATYRSGIGLPGMVEAEKLTLLQTRPLGIRSVTNPLPPSAAAEPESRDSARTNAPLTVLTMDRIVSLRDFEDFARAFAGIGKAQSVELRQAETQLVYLTIATALPTASPDATEAASALATHIVDPASELYTNLVKAIEGASDPSQQFIVDSYQPLFFNVRAKMLMNPRYVPAVVLAEVEAALKNAFSFEQRGFGQPVTSAEVVTVIQSVPGVVAVDLDQLFRYQEDEALPDPEAQIIPEAGVLAVRRVRRVGDKAEFLLINPVGITLGEMQP